MSKLKWIILLFFILAIVGLGFWVSSENSQLVRPTLIGFQLWEFNLGAWLFLAVLLGGIVGYLISLISIIPLKTRQRSVGRKLAKKDREITRLKNTAVGR